MTTPAQARAVLLRNFEEGSPIAEVIGAVLDAVDDLAVELSRTDIAMGRVLDLVTDGSFEASTLPEDWTDRR